MKHHPVISTTIKPKDLTIIDEKKNNKYQPENNLNNTKAEETIEI